MLTRTNSGPDMHGAEYAARRVRAASPLMASGPCSNFAVGENDARVFADAPRKSPSRRPSRINRKRALATCAFPLTPVRAVPRAHHFKILSATERAWELW